jgi:hypothetical protein
MTDQKPSVKSFLTATMSNSILWGANATMAGIPAAWLDFLTKSSETQRPEKALLEQIAEAIAGGGHPTSSQARTHRPFSRSMRLCLHRSSTMRRSCLRRPWCSAPGTFRGPTRSVVSTTSLCCSARGRDPSNDSRR